MDDREHSVQYFLDLIKKSHRGKFKVYIGMIAGVGKSYRMLQEAHELLENGVNVQIGYIETHGRAGTEALLQGLPVIPRRKIFYKGKELEEMDLDTIIRVHPEIVIVDELAHTNVEGSLNEKRWQDVITLLDEGIITQEQFEMKKKQIKFFPDVYKDRIGKSYNDYIAGHQMNLFEDFIGYQGSAVLDEPEQKTDTISVPILKCEEPENIPLPDLQEQPENVQRPGSEVVEKGMLT